MMLEAIYHKTYSEYAFPLNTGTLVIRLRTKKNDIHRVFLLFYEKYDPEVHGSKEMRKVASDGMFDYYEGVIDTGIKRIKYMFYLESTYEAMWYNADGFFTQRPAWGFFCYSRIALGDVVKKVDWFENAVIYQVLPDRFFSPALKKHDGGNKEWGRKEKRLYNHYGGTIRGMILKIHHLVRLGVNALYLNPVFQSNSYHRYDIIDYYTIDPLLGTQEEFIELVGLCHQNNMKVILDGVFSHCSSSFFAFQDVEAKGMASPYRDWFHIHSYPLKNYPKPNYECFSYFGGMPKLNTSNPKVWEYFGDVAAYWIREYHIDGWRFDVADELERPFIRYIRDRIKGAASHAVLIAEIFDDASSWLQGDQFDSSINYPLKSFINDLVAYQSNDVQQFKNRLNGFLMRHKSGIPQSMVNIIGTHDTARFLTLCDDDRKRFFLAVVLQFTLPGVPLIYYGDEIGMTGEGDPDCRKPMVWDENQWVLDIYQLYTKLIGFRKTYSALTNGIYRDLDVKGNKSILAYQRENLAGTILVVMNTSDEQAAGTIVFSGVGNQNAGMKDLCSHHLSKMNDGRVEVSLLGYEWHIYEVCVS